MSKRNGGCHRVLQCVSRSLTKLPRLSAGGYAGLQRIAQWNLDFMAKSDQGGAYMDLAKRVGEAINFMTACGLDSHTPIMTETEYYVSHECLLLDYEQALTREDSTTGLW
jgi:3-deoxy-7-phosphoheptulonate synthase